MVCACGVCVCAHTGYDIGLYFLPGSLLFPVGDVGSQGF